jgi:hypothetical protein
MNHRQAVVQADYEELMRWWKAHGWEGVPKELLPPTGFIAYDDKPRAAGWLYLDANVPFGMMEWIVTNPDNTPRQSFEAVKTVVEQITWLADEIKLLAVHTSVQHASLIKLYQKVGFEQADQNMINLVRSKSWQ